MHRRWLTGLSFEHAPHYTVLEDCIAAVEAATVRRDRLESDWSLTPVVKAHAARAGSPRRAMARRGVCIEAAWSCRFPARIGHDLLLRQEKLSKPVRDMAWKVQERAFVCLAIAQTKPESSRAIAAVITVFSFPACPSFRYRRHSSL
jgi:hypothetical protein